MTYHDDEVESTRKGCVEGESIGQAYLWESLSYPRATVPMWTVPAVCEDVWVWVCGHKHQA